MAKATSNHEPERRWEELGQAIAELDNSYRIQRILNSLLEVSVSDMPLEKQLKLAIDIILSAPFIPLERMGGIFLTEVGHKDLILKADSGLPGSLLEMCARVPFGRCLCGRAASDKRLIFVDHIDSRHENLYEGMRPHGHYSIPIISQVHKDRILGVIVLYVRPGHVSGDKETEFLQAVANVISGLIERKQAEEKLRQSEALEDALNRLNVALNSTLDFDRIMKMVAKDAAKVLGCDAAAIILRNQDGWSYRYTYGLPDARQCLTVPCKDGRCMVLAACTQKTVVSKDSYNDKRVDQKMIKQLGIRSFISVPLTNRKEVFGVLDFYYRSPVDLSRIQIGFADKLGVSVSLAMENARLYSVEHNIAKTLQEALLILPDRVEGLDLGYLYRSATEAVEVGGDFLDIFELESGHIGLVIGDVSGKGLEIATLTSLVKSAIKAYAYQGDLPGETIRKTSIVLDKATPATVFVTLVFAVFDRGSGALNYCVAGHPPPIVKEKAGGVRLLTKRSPVIGTSGDFEYSDHSTTLNKGDFLVLYTDGVTEARRGREFFGEKRLVEFIRNVSVKKAQTLADFTYNEIMRFSKSTLADDLAIMVVGRTEEQN